MKDSFQSSHSIHPLAKGDMDDISVPQALVDRLKLNNIILQMKCSSHCNVHDSKSCDYCQSQEGKISKHHFLRNSTNRLERSLVSTKVERHLLNQNSLTLTGKIAAELPRPSDNPELIWQRLLRKNKPSISDTS